MELAPSLNRTYSQSVLESPEVSNPKLMVIVGSFGLLSNIVGLFLFHGKLGGPFPFRF